MNFGRRVLSEPVDPHVDLRVSDLHRSIAEVLGTSRTSTVSIASSPRPIPNAVTAKVCAISEFVQKLSGPNSSKRVSRIRSLAPRLPMPTTQFGRRKRTIKVPKAEPYFQLQLLAFYFESSDLQQ